LSQASGRFSLTAKLRKKRCPRNENPSSKVLISLSSNTRWIDSSDFSVNCSAAEAYRRLIQAFEKKMQTSFMHPHIKKEMSYNEALNLQARHLRAVIEENEQKYNPLLIR